MKHIVVTGGAKGIVRAIVENLASDYQITATYNGSHAAAIKLEATYPNLKFVQVDLEDRAALESFITDMQGGAAIDALINNAGLYVGKPFMKMSAADLYQQVDLNLTAPARLMQGLLPALQKSQSPLIINVSSQAVHAKLTGEAMYSAAKTALSTLSYVLRAELNPLGVRVVSFEPFAVNTYGMDEPSNMILPEEAAQTIRYALELPDHLQVDTLGLSHIKQTRPDYPDWIQR